MVDQKFQLIRILYISVLSRTLRKCLLKVMVRNGLLYRFSNLNINSAFFGISKAKFMIETQLSCYNRSSKSKFFCM